MRTAVLISGAPNFFEDTHAYIKNNILKFIGEYDVFVDMWEIDHEVKLNLNTLYSPILQNYEPFDENSKYKVLNFSSLTKNGVQSTTCFMWHKLYSGMNSIIEFSEINNINYDLFLRIRLDFCPTTSLNEDVFNKAKSKENLICGVHVADNHAGDNFFCCHFDLLKKYRNFYLNFENFVKFFKYEKPEQFFYFQLNSLKIPIIEFPCHWLRVYNDPRITGDCNKALLFWNEEGKDRSVFFKDNGDMIKLFQEKKNFFVKSNNIYLTD